MENAFLTGRHRRMELVGQIERPGFERGERILQLCSFYAPRRDYGYEGLSLSLPVSGRHPLLALWGYTMGGVCRRPRSGPEREPHESVFQLARRARIQLRSR